MTGFVGSSAESDLFPIGGEGSEADVAIVEAEASGEGGDSIGARTEVGEPESGPDVGEEEGEGDAPEGANGSRKRGVEGFVGVDGDERLYLEAISFAHNEITKRMRTTAKK